MQASEFKQNFRVKLDYFSVFSGTISFLFFLYECTSVQNGISTVSDQSWFEVNMVDITCMQEMAKSYQTAIFDSVEPIL